ncbi:helix-turn-helix domain-containing protein [Paracidovorax konjaci]|uniref:HTH-type transcriptional regulator / antitoxin HipB n=1 Tax=Paracidovorax konjaci TaxID=32040 RepID=A0A1I1VBQ9_9BURK|nr:helix-turn-helix domain-containing protein [Paracidovorax konjaci]SFD80319.1 HTH-type transcriptional regulator / antitoxin HipB [Paracidovorax konjaci]
MDFPIHLSGQLREHLRALRKARGLTQAALGQLLGVGQARIAEIEGNPGAVSVEQLMKVLSALQVGMVLRDAGPEASAADRPGTEAAAAAGRSVPLSAYGRRPAPEKAVASRSGAQTPSEVRTVREPDPAADAAPRSARNYVIPSKRGSW